MKILGIDTSSKFLSIALSENENIIIEEMHLLERRHSSELIPKIRGMLEKANSSIDRVDAFVVGLGPGSFTGLRIGVSAVKGFGVATKKPCIGVASIDALAALFKAKPWTENVQGLALNRAKIVPIIDAKRQNVYSAVYKKGVKKSKYLLIKIDELMKKIKGPTIFLGDAIDIYREKIEKRNKKAIFLNEEYWYPRASNLIRLGFGKLKKHKKPDLGNLEPIYLYPKDCQVRKT